MTTLSSRVPPPLRVNGGVYIFDPRVLELLPDEGDHEEVTLPRLIQARQLIGYLVDGPWRAINTPGDLDNIERELASVTDDA
ncbi:hypothetical protein ACFYWU_41955 [Streptomyces chrestomyceticus]|uniref:hypothetical protein n=1 Tax=Streptomyces chrestomyceticus TaxID=68185 RepID=UPI0036B0ACB9